MAKAGRCIHQVFGLLDTRPFTFLKRLFHGVYAIALVKCSHGLNKAINLKVIWKLYPQYE